ncbi:MAG: TIGR02206 family membrane protein [Clostridiales bacterium]|nr:TIGR02206 family membrane protein [Clostridiales bacterium]
MKEYISAYYYGEPFILFSKEHIVALIFIFAFNILIYFTKEKLRKDKVDMLFRNFIASALLITELSFQLWCGFTGVWTAEYNLPFHLCSVATIICAVMLYKNSYNIYKLAYFWGLGGAIPALITPDLSGYNYPHYVFFKYFILHGLIIISVIYMTFVHSYKLKLKDFTNAFIYTNIYALFVIPVNILSGGNYLFLCRKPEALTLLDYLGSWPWYIISMEIVVLAMFFVLYLPFAIKDTIERYKSSGSGLNLGS